MKYMKERVLFFLFYFIMKEIYTHYQSDLKFHLIYYHSNIHTQTHIQVASPYPGILCMRHSQKTTTTPKI